MSSSSRPPRFCGRQFQSRKNACYNENGSGSRTGKRDDVCPGSPYFDGRHNNNLCGKSPKDRSSSSSSSSGSASASGSSGKTLSKSALDYH